jgi:hypothetical protein
MSTRTFRITTFAGIGIYSGNFERTPSRSHLNRLGFDFIEKDALKAELSRLQLGNAYVVIMAKLNDAPNEYDYQVILASCVRGANWINVEGPHDIRDWNIPLLLAVL